MQLISAGYRRYILIILTLVYAFNFIDRQIIGILSPFIKADLGLDDAQMGWLKGIYFALLYTLIGLPVAWLADRYHRVNIITISLTLWSGFTALSGFATSYFQLAAARIGVGIGEAGGSPPAHSILSDLYPKAERAGALGIYSLGIPFGIMAAYFASAFFLQGGSADWRTVMISVGLPGVLLAVLLRLTVPEPMRGKMPESTVTRPTQWQTIVRLLKVKSWWGMAMGISFASYANYAIATWMMDYYTRAFPALDITSLLITLGVVNGTLYALGVWGGGVIADRWGQKDIRAYAWLPAFSMLIGVPGFYFSLQTDSLWLSVAGLTLSLVASGTYFGPCFAMAQNLAPANVRAMSTALLFLVLNLIALGGGPTITGIISQALTDEFGATQALRFSLELLVIPFAMAIAAFFWTTRHIAADWRNADTYS